MARRAPVNVLLDTCALLALADGHLPSAAADALRRAPEAQVSAVSAWEAAIKVAGKLRLAEAPTTWVPSLLDRYDLREVPLTATVASAAACLPPLHRDPFDRMIVALCTGAATDHSGK